MSTVMGARFLKSGFLKGVAAEEYERMKASKNGRG